MTCFCPNKKSIFPNACRLVTWPPVSTRNDIQLSLEPSLFFGPLMESQDKNYVISLSSLCQSCTSSALFSSYPKQHFTLTSLLGKQNRRTGHLYYAVTFSEDERSTFSQSSRKPYQPRYAKRLGHSTISLLDLEHLPTSPWAKTFTSFLD